jgi:hypothetical protein
MAWCRYSPLGHAGPTTVVERLHNAMDPGAALPSGNGRSHAMLRQFVFFVGGTVIPRILPLYQAQCG